MNAIELVDPATGPPSAAIAARVQQLAKARGLLLACGVSRHVTRRLYPLTIPQTHFEDSLLVLGDCLRAACLADRA